MRTKSKNQWNLKIPSPPKRLMRSLGGTLRGPDQGNGHSNDREKHAHDKHIRDIIWFVRSYCRLVSHLLYPHHYIYVRVRLIVRAFEAGKGNHFCPKERIRQGVQTRSAKGEHSTAKAATSI